MNKKFRFWATELKQWINPRCWCDYDGNLIVEQEGSGEIIIQQYIGLKDIENKNIYEGDILKHKTDNELYRLKSLAVVEKNKLSDEEKKKL